MKNKICIKQKPWKFLNTLLFSNSRGSCLDALLQKTYIFAKTVIICYVHIAQFNYQKLVISILILFIGYRKDTSQ